MHFEGIIGDETILFASESPVNFLTLDWWHLSVERHWFPGIGDPTRVFYHVERTFGKYHSRNNLLEKIGFFSD